jgi:hypothetical protein
LKRVVIGVRNGEPYVVSKNGKVEVVFKFERRKPFRKKVRTLMYRIKTIVGLKRVAE